MTQNTYLLFIDSGSQPAMGASAAAFIAKNSENEQIHAQANFLGQETSNAAEYRALINGLQYLLNHRSKSVRVHSDLQLLVKQMTGAWKVKDGKLQELHREAKRLEAQFDMVEYVFEKSPSELKTSVTEAIRQGKRNEMLLRKRNPVSVKTPSQTFEEELQELFG